MITSTTEGQRDNSLVVPVQMSRAISEFPTEIVRLVFETSVAPGAQVGGDQQRQRSGYACCLVSKEVKAWVEPMLYERVVLESSTQVMAFLDALELKSAGFLSRTMKAVWILDNSFPDNAINRFQLLSSKCLSLEHLVYLGDEPCSRILQTLLEVHSAPLALRELTVIQPRHDNALCLDLTHQLSIQKLQIVDNDTLLTAHFLDPSGKEGFWTPSEQFPKSTWTLTSLEAMNTLYGSRPNSFPYLLGRLQNRRAYSIYVPAPSGCAESMTGVVSKTSAPGSKCSIQ